ncbi:ribokinase [Microbacterium sp.]|uniref:ribokinase n=1 Tax=Microbacterium sp. TaxID=51671 RepID=UPI002E30116E|nr:ribokinase [Microbacterium sp.]HEX5730142.1 ribokinase [Microbacterium sp.]
MTRGVVVLGSANVDLMVEVERRPHGGETLLGSDIRTFAGGKGANQAAAAARAGAPTRFIACVGQDGNGEFLRSQLTLAGVDVSGIQAVPHPTGTAMILVTPDGENSIVVSPGANRAMDLRVAEATAETWLHADVLVLNLEIPLETVHHLIDRAAESGVRIVLNAAPAASLDRRMLRHCDPLIVNEHEARFLLDADAQRKPEEMAADLLGEGARSVVITVGAAGSVVADAGGVTPIPAHRVEAVDTTGAGDAFVGAAACELARGEQLRSAVRFATAMSALSVQDLGAQSSYPDRAAVERFLRRLGEPGTD